MGKPHRLFSSDAGAAALRLCGPEERHRAYRGAFGGSGRTGPPLSTSLPPCSRGRAEAPAARPSSSVPAGVTAPPFAYSTYGLAVSSRLELPGLRPSNGGG